MATNQTQQVIVQESGIGHLTQEIIIGTHHLVADEPQDKGGNGTGPTPYDYILAGLGACTCMTLRVYADFKKIPLKKVRVQLAHQKIYATDCADCENSDAKIDHIDRKIALEGELTEEQRLKLMEIADKCPVHRTLTSKTSITTTLVDHIN